MKNLIIFTLLVLAVIFALVKMTDKICDKTYSVEFKQTQQFKAMQCPTK